MKLHLLRNYICGLVTLLYTSTSWQRMKKFKNNPYETLTTPIKWKDSDWIESLYQDFSAFDAVYFPESWRSGTLGPKLHHIESIPPRNRTYPYLIWMVRFEYLHPGITNEVPGWFTLMKSRDDILWVMKDLRIPAPFEKLIGSERIANFTMEGVTYPGSPLKRYGGPTPPNPGDARKYLLTFRGRNNPGWDEPSNVREDLVKAFEIYSSREDISLQLFPEAPSDVSDDNQVQYWDSFNSTFVFVPRGNARWSFRFIEVVGACAIPVIVADGLSLPFANIIDWESMVVRIPQKDVKDASKVLSKIESLSKSTRKRMQEKLCYTNRKYFATYENYQSAFHGSVKAIIDDRRREGTRL